MKKIVSMVLTLCLTLSFVVMPVKAAEDEQNRVDGSLLTKEESSRGTTNLAAARGAYMMDGECSITRAGRGRVYVYASTTANHTVDYVSAVIYVERYNEETEHWGTIDCWQVEDRDTYYVSTSKVVQVESGYYYRTRADHVAGMDEEYPYDEATSHTDGIYMQ